jgi:hypothetical protein
LVAATPTLQVKPSYALHVEERLVDGQRLDHRRDRLEHGHHLLRHRLVPVEMRHHDLGRRAQAHRLADGHRGADSVSSRFVGRTGDHRATIGCTDDQRQPAQ